MVRRAPTAQSEKIGYLRAGARVKRSEVAVGYSGCERGWYRVAPMGYACVGSEAVLDSDELAARAIPAPPDRDAPLPYTYARAKGAGPLKYVRIPLQEQRRRYESASVSAPGIPPPWRDLRFDPIPEFLQAGRAAPTQRGYEYGSQTLYLEQALPRSGFALRELFQAPSGSFGLSVDFEILPLDRLQPVTGSEFEGVRVDGSRTRAVAFVKSAQTVVFTPVAEPTAGFVEYRRAARREAFSLAEGRQRWRGRMLVETLEGTWLDSAQVLIVSAHEPPPRQVVDGGTWVDISITDQTLVAYEGSEAVYATLVSTGVMDAEESEVSTETPRGIFRVHTKHVTATMSGDEPGEEYSMGHVPWVQYFEGNYAIHAAYWHDAFGRRKSHGCVNLSPADALWLFKWTSPPVPRAWHGAMSTEGTVLRIRD